MTKQILCDLVDESEFCMFLQGHDTLNVDSLARNFAIPSYCFVAKTISFLEKSRYINSNVMWSKQILYIKPLVSCD